MTREEAIRRLNKFAENAYGAWHDGDADIEAIDMAIEALQAEPTGEYIDKEFELKHYRSMLNKDTPDVTDKDRMNAQIIIEALEMAKTVKVQSERHGEWETRKGIEYCSECNASMTWQSTYCPNCGAKMDKE